jgi:hypothetical protein
MIAAGNSTHHWRWIASAFAASAALLGGIQALLPAPAFAMTNEDEICQILMNDGRYFYNADTGSCELPDGTAGGGPLPAPVTIIPVTGKARTRIFVSTDDNRQPKRKDDDSRQNVGADRDGWDRGHKSCKRASGGPEGVCPRPVTKQKSLSETLKEEKEQARLCRDVERRLNDTEARSRDFEAGRWVPQYHLYRDDGSEITDPDEKRRQVREAGISIESRYRRELREYECDLRPMT